MNRAAVSVTKCYTSIISFSRIKVENYFFYTSQTIYIAEKQVKRRNTFVLIVSYLHK